MGIPLSVCFVVIFLSVGMLSSCSSERKTMKDKFELSTKRAEFSARADSIVIMTEGDIWWINDVDDNGNRLFADTKDMEGESMQIKGEWFTVKKQGHNKLIVKVLENYSKDKREMVITLESGNYFDCIDVLQKGQEGK
ncbi:MAG: hypothetical protein E6772_02120 [Dysgonomonas sp.]|nr:hypothetical protein [Dysgonomonas sp.]